jgi:hypothetical protein
MQSEAWKWSWRALRDFRVFGITMQRVPEVGWFTVTSAWLILQLNTRYSVYSTLFNKYNPHLAYLLYAVLPPHLPHIPSIYPARGLSHYSHYFHYVHYFHHSHLLEFISDRRPPRPFLMSLPARHKSISSRTVCTPR